MLSTQCSLHSAIPPLQFTYRSPKTIPNHGAVDADKSESLLAVVNDEGSCKLPQVYASALLPQLCIAHLKCRKGSMPSQSGYKATYLLRRTVAKCTSLRGRTGCPSH